MFKRQMLSNNDFFGQNFVKRLVNFFGLAYTLKDFS
jgi:hypothetical protein